MSSRRPDRASLVRIATLAMATLSVVALATPAHAQEGEEPGTWRFTDDTKAVKVVVIGGSVSAYPAGSFAQWLPAVCRDIEIVNRGKAKLGAADLRRRFTAQVLKNRRIDEATKKKTWLLFLGGLNSIGTPETTNLDLAKTFKAAKDAGLSTMGVTINPWGSETDHRWQGIDGLAYWEHSQRAVDFLLGRLNPAQAFGEAIAKTMADPSRFDAGQLPDIAVDVWDGPLRDLTAAPRDLDKLRRGAKRSTWVKKRLDKLPDGERPAALEALLQRASELPRWFMRQDFVAFDPIHPNAQGHKEIARAICSKAPPTWGCACAELDRLTWDRRTNQPKAP